MKLDLTINEMNDESTESVEDSKYSSTTNNDSTVDGFYDNDEEREHYESPSKHVALKENAKNLDSVSLLIDADKTNKDYAANNAFKELSTTKKRSVLKDNNNNDIELNLKKRLAPEETDNKNNHAIIELDNSISLLSSSPKKKRANPHSLRISTASAKQKTSKRNKAIY